MAPVRCLASRPRRQQRARPRSPSRSLTVTIHHTALSLRLAALRPPVLVVLRAGLSSTLQRLARCRILIIIIIIKWG